MIALRIFAVLALIATNAFFAAAEFSLVAVRLSRVRQLVDEGNARAKIVEALLADLGRVVSGVQVGVTFASLALGYLGEVTLANLLYPVAGWIPGRWAAVVTHGVALVVAFGLLNVLQVILGELVPKGLSLARAERVALLVARPFRWFLNTFSWAIDLLDGIADRIVRALGVTAPPSHTLIRSVEELRVLITEAREHGFLQPGEEEFIKGAMDLAHVEVREIMVPRPDVYALPAGADLEETMKMFSTTQRSRLPVYQGTLDHILGFVHIKDFIWLLMDRARRAEAGQPQAEFQLSRFLREVLIVPETKRASELLLEFRAKRARMAMVVDEFGSILGLVTLRNILEQMVGEMHGEFDIVEHPQALADGAMIFDAALKVRDLESEYNIVLPDDPAYETVGGFVLAKLGFIPRGGESFEADGFRFTVLDMDRKRVSRVKVQRIEQPAPGEKPVATLSGAPPAESAPAKGTAKS